MPYYGKYRAFVASVDDPEKRGRIRVLCPKLFGESLSRWCEPCIPFSINKSGDYFPSRIGDFVWIEFEGGDVKYPIYTGGLWSASSLPTDDPSTRVISWDGVKIVMKGDSIFVNGIDLLESLGGDSKYSVHYDPEKKENYYVDSVTGDRVYQESVDTSKFVPKTDYSPEVKTPAMTVPVGKDSEGKLWVEPSESDVVIDSTLTKEGQAADAKSTGDAITELLSITEVSLYRSLSTLLVYNPEDESLKSVLFPDVSILDNPKDFISYVTEKLLIGEVGSSLSLNSIAVYNLSTGTLLRLTPDEEILQTGGITFKGSNILSSGKILNETIQLFLEGEDILRMTYDHFELDTSSGGDSTDVRIDGTSITKEGVANIPLASSSQAGVIQLGVGFNYSSTTKKTSVLSATSEYIKARPTYYGSITTANLDIAVRAAMCDGHGDSWTSEEKEAARERLGISSGDTPHNVIYTLSPKGEVFCLKDDTGTEVTFEQASLFASKDLSTMFVDLSTLFQADLGTEGVFLARASAYSKGNGILFSSVFYFNDGYFSIISLIMQSDGSVLLYSSNNSVISDVVVSGSSESLIDESGLVTLPLGTSDAFGLVKPDGYTVGQYSDSKRLYVIASSNTNITNRANNGSIRPSNLDFAVKAALTDKKGADYTEAEKLAARERLGVVNGITLEDIYPIGSLYFAPGSVDPNSTLGFGEWRKVTALYLPASNGVSVWSRLGTAWWGDRQVSGAAYGFTYMTDYSGYYESTNKGVANSYAIMYFEFDAAGRDVYLNCLCDAESNYDYATIGEVDKVLRNDTSFDGITSVPSSVGASEVRYLVASNSYGTHRVYVKFIKDGSADSGNDSLRVKLTFDDSPITSVG